MVDRNKFQRAIDSYFKLDDYIKQQEKDTRILRKKRQEIEKYILETTKRNKLQNKNLKSSDNRKLAFEKNDRFESFTKNFVKKNIEKYYFEKYGSRIGKKATEDKAEKLFNYLLSQREVIVNLNLNVVDNK